MSLFGRVRIHLSSRGPSAAFLGRSFIIIVFYAGVVVAVVSPDQRIQPEVKRTSVLPAHKAAVYRDVCQLVHGDQGRILGAAFDSLCTDPYQ